MNEKDEYQKKIIKHLNMLMFGSLLQGKDLKNDLSYLDDFDNNFFQDSEVNSCIRLIYLSIIKWIDSGLSYEEIETKLEEIESMPDEYEKLSDLQKEYVKGNAKKVLVLRRQMKGNDIYE